MVSENGSPTRRCGARYGGSASRRSPGCDGSRRQDRGQARKQRQQMIARAVELKRQQPGRSPRTINKFLAKEFGRTIPASTMNRHFRQQGVTRRKLGVEKVKIRCRWTREQSNALWLGDFADGPVVMHAGRAIKSHLSVWIDCHSRYVVEGRYYFRENLDILIDSLLRAWAAQGASRQLYVDNAKIYHARGLRLACTHLNIELLHRPPREPQPGGLVERVIQTIQQQFEAEVRAGTVLTLAELNRYFQAWLHRDYHVTVHSETKQTPQARYEESTRFRRHVNLAEVREFFYVRERRKVDPEFSDVRVKNRFYAVDPRLRGDRVIVSYDPFSSGEEVRLTSLHGVFLGVARHYDRERGAHPQPPPTAPHSAAGPRVPEAAGPGASAATATASGTRHRLPPGAAPPSAELSRVGRHLRQVAGPPGRGFRARARQEMETLVPRP